MNIDQVEIDRIASALATRIAPQVPIEYQIWDAKQVAAYLGISAWSFRAEYAPHPKFPRPIRVPNANGNHMHPRWKALDVIGYMDDCKDR